MFIMCLFIWPCWVFIAACRLFSLVAVSRSFSLVAVVQLLIVVASLVAELSLLDAWASVVVAHRLSCSTSGGIFLERGSNPCLLL